MAPSPTIRRLLKETKELSPSAPHPNPTFHAAPVSDDNLHEWHFTLLGPPAPSPYAGGIYHGRITLPHAYPMKPPNFRFLTPSGRFEVNREICLSISGFHEETWQPAWGVRTALVALRGFMGEEGTAGQVGGLESSKEVRQRLAKESRGWRCNGCGDQDAEDREGNRRGMTNEERMKWWWIVCRKKGVDVEKEVEGMESLPEGFKYELREVQREDKGKEKEKRIPQDEQSRPRDEQNTQESVVPASTTSNQRDAVELSRSQNPQPSTQQASISHSSDEVTLPNQSQLVGTQADGRPISSPQTRQQQLLPLPQLQLQRQIQPGDSVVTIDRAIAGVFLALVLMILKKVLYPSSAGLWGSGYDDLRMVRE
ncbi:hypothetical protein H2198_000677 [Neophaeococcomyces mojaviensis]|uniref:Uncharacterized protein n=1 Tax=Neophaeococcomyces mojaviensis TaxID=3383035 RepID=A0ACC3AJ46_9EURO|nr:hypothetical protein H2198_000677 [Knufia sp. JES_112]